MREDAKKKRLLREQKDQTYVKNIYEFLLKSNEKKVPLEKL